VVAVVLAYVLIGRSREKRRLVPNDQSNKAAIKVKVVHPRRGGLALTTTQPAVVHAYDYVRLYAKVSGFLRGQVVDIGDTVERGQMVARVFAPEIQQQVEQASAAVEQAKAGVVQAEALVTVARAEVIASEAEVKEREARVGEFVASRKYRQKEFVRYNELATTKVIDQRAADEKQNDFEAAKAGEDVAIAAVQTAKGRLAKATAAVEKAKADVQGARANRRVAEAKQASALIFEEYTRLTVPFDGTVTERNYHDGDFIRAADSGSDTPPILMITRNDLMRVIVEVPDRDVPYVDRGDPAVIEVDSLGAEQFRGVVSRYSSMQSSFNRAMRVEVDLPNPSGRLHEGMYGNLTIQLEPPAMVLAVPSPAIIANDGHGKGAVYVARERKARRVAVRVGRDNGLVAEIRSGLTENDEVVVSHSASIEDGSDIEPLAAIPAETDGTQPNK
jgi:RND family efflux transporter MFP subunit